MLYFDGIGEVLQRK